MLHFCFVKINTDQKKKYSLEMFSELFLTGNSFEFSALIYYFYIQAIAFLTKSSISRNFVSHVKKMCISL